MYRFRPIEKLLGAPYNELERQVIYFAEPDELNDPMEGAREFYWSGDEIVWENLFKHYVACLERTFSIGVVGGVEHRLCKNDVLVFPGVNGYAGVPHQKTLDGIIKDFISPEVLAIAHSLAKRRSPVKKHELVSFLMLVHQRALAAIHAAYSKFGVSNFPSEGVFSVLDGAKASAQATVADLINQLEEANPEMPDVGERVSEVLGRTKIQMDLLAAFEHRAHKSVLNTLFLTSSFPEVYVAKLEELAHPNWYTACFMESCENTSVWGHYAQGHRGICLKFKTEEKTQKLGLTLNVPIGWGHAGAIFGERLQKFHKIEYGVGRVEVDFFKSIGRLSHSQIFDEWYRSPSGGISKCAPPGGDFTDDWRRDHWGKFQTSITRKSIEWAYEREHRLVLNGMLHDFKSPEERSIKYRFEDLDGVIFGERTRMEDKLEVMRIIEEKCRSENRRDFNFYQAHYSGETNKTEYFKMNLLEVKF